MSPEPAQPRAPGRGWHLDAALVWRQRQLALREQRTEATRVLLLRPREAGRVDLEVQAAPDVHVHLSPPCTSLSKARAGSAPATSVAAALDAVRWCVQLVLEKGYVSWSMENVATPAVVACVAELARQHPCLLYTSPSPRD